MPVNSLPATGGLVLGCAARGRSAPRRGGVLGLQVVPFLSGFCPPGGGWNTCHPFFFPPIRPGQLPSSFPMKGIRACGAHGSSSPSWSLPLDVGRIVEVQAQRFEALAHFRIW